MEEQPKRAARSLLEDDDLAVVVDTDDDEPELAPCERCGCAAYLHHEGQVCGGCGSCKMFKPM